MAMTTKPKTQKISHGQLPSKQSINLATVGVKKMKTGLLIPLLILVLAAAVCFAKFAVIDRLNALAKEKAEVERLEQEIATGYAKIDSYGELTEKYAHYTFSDMTQEELTRSDRVEIVDLVRRIVLPEATVTGWDIRGNELTLTLTSDTLQQINLIAQKIEAENIVDFCTVTTAATYENQYYYSNDPADTRVTAKIVVYLKNKVQEVAL